MNDDQVKKVVCEVVEVFQITATGECPALDEKTIPLKNLPEFDSPISLGATGKIGRRLGITIPPKTNIFGDKDQKYSIGQTVTLLCKLLEEAKSKNELASA